MALYDIESSKYTKLKKAYVVENGKYVKLKKAYVVENGKYVKIWSGGEVKYYGTIDNLSTSKYQLSGASVGQYALFGGGCSTTSSSSYSATVDTYNSSLTKGTATGLGNARTSPATTTFNGYALFVGGTNSSSVSSTVDTYNSSLTKGSATALSVARRSMGVTSTPTHALVAGGWRSGSSSLNSVETYNTSMTRGSATNLTIGNRYLTATNVGQYAIIGAGCDENTANGSTTLDVYDSSLTKSTLTMASARTHAFGTKVGDFALIGGGRDYKGNYFYDVEAWNKSLTRSLATELSYKSSYLYPTAVSNGEVATFFTIPSSVYAQCYDESLTKIKSISMSSSDTCAGAVAGDYAVLVGGYAYGKTGMVEAIQIA